VGTPPRRAKTDSSLPLAFDIEAVFGLTIEREFQRNHDVEP
jgi:hypothetical protein